MRHTVGDIDGEKDDSLKSLIKHVRLTQLRLEVSGTREHQTRHVGSVQRDEVQRRLLGHLPECNAQLNSMGKMAVGAMMCQDIASVMKCSVACSATCQSAMYSETR